MQKNKPAPSVGIYIGPGAKNVQTAGNEIRGFERGIEDHGSENFHSDNLIAPSEDSERDESTADEKWYKKPIGVLGLAVFSGLLLYAAKWAINHYFS